MATSHVCSCFSNLQSRYKRLVNNVFPSNPNEGLVKSNMEKLSFYALQAPEKLDRIGEHMFTKTNNYLYRKKMDYVYIAMEAMDLLLQGCGGSSFSLNVFVESFLKMVTLLLESTDIGLQIRGAASFVKFANIDEDTPSYHRRYEFFISRFSTLCYGNHSDKDIEKKIRLSGLQGLQGVVRKTVNDDLQANIWDESYISRIVPALLFNIECSSEALLRRSSANDLTTQQREIGQDQNDPAGIADSVLRELVARAGFNNIAAILSPLLEFMDDRKLWLNNEFPLHIFRIVMYSIPNHFSYRAIELLFSHLDSHANSEANMRASIVEMISASVTIATGGSLGPSLLEVFNTLLKHLKISVDFMDASGADATDSMNKLDVTLDDHPEMLVQKAIIEAAGSFSSILQDYQRVDVMLYILTKIPRLTNLPTSSSGGGGVNKRHSMLGKELDAVEAQQERMEVDLLKFLLQVSKVHQVKQFQNTFSPKIIDALLPGLGVPNTRMRLHVLELWVLLLDRHKNMGKLDKLVTGKGVTEGDEISFSTEKCAHPDALFVKKNRQSLFFHIYESFLLPTNESSHIKLLGFLICLLSIECDHDDNVLECVSLILGLQQFARADDSLLVDVQKTCIHAVVILFFQVVSQLPGFSGLAKHCQEVITSRQDGFSWMLPGTLFQEGFEFDDAVDGDDVTPPEDVYYFDVSTIVEALQDNKYDMSAVEMPYVQKCNNVIRTKSIQSIPDNTLSMKKAESQMSIKSSSVYQHRSSVFEAPVPKITYEDLKDALRGEKVDRNETVLDFNVTPFSEIASNNERMTKEREAKMKRLLDAAEQNTYGQVYQQEVQKNLFEIQFPALFVY